MPVKPELCILFKVQRIWKDLFLCNINIFLLNYWRRQASFSSAEKKSSFPYSERCRNTLRGHADSVNSIVFLPYSNTLLTCSADKTLSLWDARTVSKFFYALVSCPLFVLKNVSHTNRLLPLYFATVV